MGQCLLCCSLLSILMLKWWVRAVLSCFYNLGQYRPRFPSNYTFKAKFVGDEDFYLVPLGSPSFKPKTGAILSFCILHSTSSAKPQNWGNFPLSNHFSSNKTGAGSFILFHSKNSQSSLSVVAQCVFFFNHRYKHHTKYQNHENSMISRW